SRCALFVLAVIAMTACQTTHVAKPPHPPPQIKTVTLARYEPASLEQAPQVSDADLLAAWPALLASCNVFDRTAKREKWSTACAAARLANASDPAAIRAVLASEFAVFRILIETREATGSGGMEPRTLDITDRGRLTGYYEPELNGSRTPV